MQRQQMVDLWHLERPHDCPSIRHKVWCDALGALEQIPIRILRIEVERMCSAGVANDQRLLCPDSSKQLHHHNFTAQTSEIDLWTESALELESVVSLEGPKV